MGAKSAAGLANEIHSSLHFDSFSWNLFWLDFSDQIFHIRLDTAVFLLVNVLCNSCVIYVFPQFRIAGVDVINPEDKKLIL